MPPRKASRKSLEQPSIEASRERLRRPSRKAFQKCLELFNTSQTHSDRQSRKASQKSLKMMPSKATQKSLQKPLKKASEKCPESETKAVVLRSQKNSKVVVRKQSVVCTICKKNCTSKRKLKDHNIKHHFFRHCPNCPKTFQQTRKFILHLRSHLEDHPYECKICLECFNKKGDLLIHKKGHKNPRRLNCDLCSEVFPHRASLNRHRLVHDGPPYVCEDCGANFSNIPDITVHSKNHVHRCVFCPKEVVAFSSNFDLASHISRMHPMEEYEPNENEAINTLEPCVSTGAVNLEDSGSDSMEDISSDEESDADVANNYQSDAVEPVYNLKRKDKYICFICYDLYPSCELLMSHMKAHKWYPCKSCPRFFADAQTLVQHKCDFVEVPSFICEICNTETKCENCMKKFTEMRDDVSEVYINALRNNVSRFPELPRVPVNYCDVAERNLLYDFVEQIKSQKVPLDVQSFNHIGLHYKCLEQILENPGVRRLFPNEYIPYIKDLHSKFQDLSQTLCNQLNRSFIQSKSIC